MARDFTCEIYRSLLSTLLNTNYSFQTFEEFLKNPAKRSVVLRHDVDARALNSLHFAEIQADMGIRGVYYFRAVPQSWNVEIIKKIASLGHEIGYHYECLTTCAGNMESAIADFGKNLTALRQLAPVSTICMHGSPMSPYDSKDLWNHYSYESYDIIGEPYFDVDFKQVFYLTDTGRSWDGGDYSVRDKVDSSFSLSYNSTTQIITSAQEQALPDQIMFTFHPQRWTDNMAKWGQELVLQNIKNVIKKYFFVKKT